jgi:hypothetical protein
MGNKPKGEAIFGKQLRNKTNPVLLLDTMLNEAGKAVIVQPMFHQLGAIDDTRKTGGVYGIV